MKCAMIFADSGPIVIATCFDSLTDPALLRRLAQKGMEKFIAFELPVASVKARYGSHFSLVCEDLKETDDLRVLDYDGDRALSLFDFAEFGPPIFHEPVHRHAMV
jgi:hypothetical protein